MKTCSLDVTAFETFHVQQPKSRTDPTFDLKSHNFKLILKLLFRHTTDNTQNAALVFSISVPPPAAIMLFRLVIIESFTNLTQAINDDEII